MHRARAFFIAEAGVNHNGSLELALQLVEVAAKAGADAVKFQTFKTDQLVSRRAAKADYQVQTTGAEGTQMNMLRSLELSPEDHHAIAKRCKELGVAFMSTAFDIDSLRFLKSFDIPAIKIASGDLTAAPLLLEAARLRLPLIVSTGMATLSDITEALGVIAFGILDSDSPPSADAFAEAYASPAGRAAIVENVTLLHCVSEYPAPLDEVNLRAMDLLRATFGTAVGYSDHTSGTSVALAAVARGAAALEKHFTLDRNLPGPDHKASLEPDELIRLVREVREIEIALGAERKEPSASELRNRVVVRRSLVAAQAIEAGDVFTERNLAVKRPGNGIQPIDYWRFLGRPASRNYGIDDMIEP